MSMVKLYANVESGRVTGADGNEYRIQSGVVMVPACCVADLETRGFVPAEKPAMAAQVEQVAAPAARKRTKK